LPVVVIGLNHRTVPLELLERVAVSSDRLPKILHDLCSRPNVSEAVVLSTCNRTEVYAVAERFHGAYQDVRDVLCELSHLAPEEFSHHLYSAFDDEAVGHLFSVASGLESAVLGETEILGQVKAAWEHAKVEGAARSTCNRLFRHALEVGKRARTETAISRHTTSVSQAAVAMAVDQLGSLDGRTVLVVGAGEMGEGMALGLRDRGAVDVMVANRTSARASELARRIGGRAIALVDVPDALATTDVLLTSTGSSHVLFTADDLSGVMTERRGRPLLVVDIAVPRDVDGAASLVPGLTLLDLDDLRQFAARGVAGRQSETAEVRRIVAEEVDRYLDEATARTVAPLVAELRERAEAVRAAEVERLAGRLSGASDREREAVDAITRGVLAKLLHEPTVRLKEAAGTPRGERYAEALRDLFDL
jgi:glutamyl-tRNA reductase